MTHPPADVREVTTDVAVIGAGPCGITMANLLAVYGVRAVVIDAQPGIYEYPRAVGIDDESLRTFQTIGIVGQAPRGHRPEHADQVLHVLGAADGARRAERPPVRLAAEEQLPPAAVRGGAAGEAGRRATR